METHRGRDVLLCGRDVQTVEAEGERDKNTQRQTEREIFRARYRNTPSERDTLKHCETPRETHRDTH